MAMTCAGVLLWSCAGSKDRLSPEDLIPAGWPLAQESRQISSPFGRSRSLGGRLHTGIDLPAPKGTLVLATAAGSVVFTGRDGRYGKMVVIDHLNGLKTHYAHLSGISVRVGRFVLRGAQIGSVGKSGNATGYHLHYEVRRDGKPVNPKPFL